eukprot:scaffold289114_cov36-Prasinocladus_malaysianus.AAC.1
MQLPVRLRVVRTYPVRVGIRARVPVLVIALSHVAQWRRRAGHNLRYSCSYLYGSDQPLMSRVATTAREL